MPDITRPTPSAANPPPPSASPPFDAERSPGTERSLAAETAATRPHADLGHIWSLIDSELAAAVDDATYRIWLAPLAALALRDDHLTITAPPQTCRWVRERFGRLLQTAAAAILGPQLTIDLVPRLACSRPGPTLLSAHASAHRGLEAPLRDPADSASPPAGTTAPDLLVNPKLTFGQFVIGDSNRLAHAAALTVAEMPSQAYNPLFICGPPGVGKTHLLHSIRALLLSHDPALTVRCLTGEQFTTAFMSALGSRATGGFKARFRGADVLLIDDVQFLERKARTEEEFFHTFNALYDAGSQIVLTSDRPPRNLDALEDRLRERFEAGLVADIHPPDRATRLTILRKRVMTDNVELAEHGVLDLLADRITLNVRALEGALIRTVAFSSLTGRPLTRDLAGEVVSTLYPARSQQLHPSRSAGCTIAEIQAAACRHFDLTVEELLSPARSKRVVWPRQLAMYLARQLTEESLPSIGRSFGGRDHSTVLHACKRTATLLDSDDHTRRAVDSLRSLLAE